MKMNRLFYILIVLMNSCSSPEAVPVPEIVPSATAMVVDVSSPTTVPLMGTDVLATVPPASPSPTMQVNEQPFSAILARMHPDLFLLLGGTENGEWLGPEVVAPLLSDGEMYQTFYADGVTGSAKGNTPEYDQFCRGYRVETDSYPFGGQAVAVTGDWNVTPRIAQELPTDNVTYVEEIRNWLIGQNVPGPVVEVDQILRVDIEGDGVDEVLISASHFIESTGHNIAPGDYSLVLMRKVVGNSVVTIPIVGDYYYQEAENQFPLTYGTLFVADLNNDDILEVLVGIERWEGAGVVLYEVKETGIQMIFNIFCGL